jgi:glycosyltransferase involved in cell wall biosynthesis
MGELRALSTVHNPGVELGRAKRRLWGPALRRMDAVVAVSRAARAGLPAGVSARVLPPSLIDPDRPLPTRAEARRALGLDPACPVVLAVGRLAPVKGLDVLARAAEALPEAEVAVIGEGPERARLAGTRLRLLGPRADAARLLPAADVVALPSRSEGFPQVPLHAMAAERPVVATRVGGTPEVVEDGGTGLLVPPEDPRALAEALRHLLATPALARRLGAAGRERLLAKGWTATGMVDATRRLYLELLGA